VTTEDQIIVAAEITTKGGDFEELDPMIAAAERELKTAGVEESPGVVLADAGYWSNEHIDSLRERGIVPIVAATPPETGRAGPGSAAPTTSCEESWPPRPVARSTPNASAWSSRSSPRSRRIGGSTASNEEAERPPARNGA